jgi:hypothetical protein
MHPGARVTITPLFLRQDLLIGLGRLEKAIDAVCSGRPSERPQRLLPLEITRARVFDILRHLSR